MNKEKFSFIETLKRNIGWIFTNGSKFLVFLFGISIISKIDDNMAMVFITLAWCYLFFKELNTYPRIIFKNLKGDIFEY